MAWWDEPDVLHGHITALDLTQFPLGATQLRSVFFHDARVEGLTLDLDDVHFGAHDSEFRGCTFRQKNKRLHPGGMRPQGRFGTGSVVYRDCRFVGIRMLAGAFNFGDARFEDCVFEKIRFGWHMSDRADLIRCTFLGRIDGGRFRGSDDSRTGGPKVNEIRENDFTGAEISAKVEWSADFPVALQRWPPGFTPKTRAYRPPSDPHGGDAWDL